MTIVVTEDGLTLARRLKADEKTKNVPVIILTDRRNAKAADGNRFMSKSHVLDVVADAVAELLNDSPSSP